MAWTASAANSDIRPRASERQPVAGSFARGRYPGNPQLAGRLAGCRGPYAGCIPFRAGRRAFLPMRRRLVTPLVLCAALAAMPAAACASANQVMTFEAPRELLDDATRDARWTRSPRSASTTCASSSTGTTSRPARTRKRAELRRDRPGGLSRRARGRGSTGCSPPRKARHVSIQLTLTGPVPKWATKAQAATRDRAGRRRSSGVRHRVGRRYGDRVSRGRSGTSPTSRSFLKPQYTQRQAPRRRSSTASSTRPADAGCARAGNARDTILIGETAPRGNRARRRAARVPARDAVPGLEVPQARRAAASSTPTATPTTPYTTAPGPRFKPAGRDDVTIGVLGAAREARSTGRRTRARCRAACPST